jgi:hypothetical protein
MDVLAEIRLARSCIPSSHRALLEQLNVQEAAVYDWPDGVMDMYRTLKERPPRRSQIASALALWLPERRTAAFNAAMLEVAVDGLNTSSMRAKIHPLAWHEYGHALSFMRSTSELRASGPALMALLPDGLRDAVSVEYEQRQIFDEVVATVYANLVGRVRDHGYRQPGYLPPRLYAAFREVIPWPPNR